MPIENPSALAAASVALAVAVVAEPAAAVAEPAAAVLVLEAEDEEAVAELALHTAEVAEPAAAALDAAAEASMSAMYACHTGFGAGAGSRVSGSTSVRSVKSMVGTSGTAT
ncbi:hypothetical protein [Pseudarthrobacter sp. NBSH8]|uniref:hypothetical protein n=1 Tax=Pseudarthrobacter sp. NBSH8 TaxID=2596911 RepID=UPI001627C9A7|nr:hypothetical protein [Pseudarthrobacter sp. NBSH8]